MVSYLDNGPRFETFSNSNNDNGGMNGDFPFIKI